MPEPGDVLDQERPVQAQFVLDPGHVRGGRGLPEFDLGGLLIRERTQAESEETGDEQDGDRDPDPPGCGGTGPAEQEPTGEPWWGRRVGGTA
jgi:hypothetical protein